METDTEHTRRVADILEAKTEELAAVVREIDRTKPPRRTDNIKHLARELIDLRQHFTTPDGSPDLAGRSYAYRSMVNDIYRQSHVPKERTQAIQALVRYHVGNLIREEFPAEELEDYGLLPETPLERSKGLREARRDFLLTVRGQDEDIDPVTIAASVVQLLRRLRPATVDNMEVHQATEFLDLMTEAFVQMARIRNLIAHDAGDRRRTGVPDFGVVIDPKSPTAFGTTTRPTDLSWSDELTRPL